MVLSVKTAVRVAQNLEVSGEKITARRKSLEATLGSGKL